MTWADCASRYHNADEIIAASRERARRAVEAACRPVAVISRPLPSKQPEMTFQTAFALWTTPIVAEMETVEEVPLGAWTRVVGGVTFVLVDDREVMLKERGSFAVRIWKEQPELRLKNGDPLRHPKDITPAVAHKHRMSVSEMLADRRHDRIVRARQEAMWVYKTYTTYSYPMIGRALGGKDHTTIIHGVRAHQARIDAGEA